MRIDPGCYRIIDSTDTITIFAMQIGVTRIGSGGRCMPRTRRGAMTSVANLVLTTIEEKIYSAPVKAVRKIAQTGRAVVALAVLVIGLTLKQAIEWSKILAGIGRVLYCLLVGRPGRLYRWKQSWTSIYRDGISDC